MNLTDKEILELSELCNAVVDGRITERQQARLSQWLASSENARVYYVCAAALSASLHHYAAEIQVEEADAAPHLPNLVRTFFRRYLVPLAVAGCIVLAFLMSKRPERGNESAGIKSEECVARLTGSKDCEWAGAGKVLKLGDPLRKGQNLELLKGYAEITFDSGAQIFLEGPSSFEVISAWDGALTRGALKASVPPEAIGFFIANEVVKVKDFGTEFAMFVDAHGVADVLVLKGEVEATPGGINGHDSILLKKNESRRFGYSGVSEVSDSDQKFGRFDQPVPLNRFTPLTRYVRWALDEAASDVLKADDFGDRMEEFDALLKPSPEAMLPGTRTEGRWNGALRFNGLLFARAAFKGMSGSSAHTVSLWVKIPEDAQLSSAYSMVAWWVDSKKLGPRPVHIGWNRNPDEGPLGVLRTDYGGGYALGATPIRDGRWHHIAVVFVPGGDDIKTPVEVKQYVDGRLEGEGRPSPSRGEFPIEVNESVKNAVWLGCRLGSSGPRRDRFRGELDELCVADCALAPQQIVHLMKENKPMQFEMAAAEK